MGTHPLCRTLAVELNSYDPVIQNFLSSLLVAVTIASTCCAYQQQRDGQAELGGWLHSKTKFYMHDDDYHLISNRCQHTATSLM